MHINKNSGSVNSDIKYNFPIFNKIEFIERYSW